MSQPTVGATASTFAEADAYVETENTTESTVVARTLVQSEAIAAYFRDDIEQFIKDAHVDLVKYLQLPNNISHELRDVLEKLYADLAHLLRDQLITGIHILLSEPQLDANLHAYLLRYHAQYVVETPARVLGAMGSDPVKRWGGRLKPVGNVWQGANFSLLVDWSPDATPDRRRLARIESGYWFNWVPDDDRYDASSLVQYRDGGMTVEGASVRRTEAAVPGSQRLP